MESLDELLASQGITLEDGEISVLEQDGRQYLIIPNVSSAQVLGSADASIPTPQYNNVSLQ